MRKLVHQGNLRKFLKEYYKYVVELVITNCQIRMKVYMELG